MKKYVLPLALSIASFISVAQLGYAQELNCEVNVSYENIKANDPTIFRSLEEKIRDFMNNTTWTTDTFQSQERIDCSIYINIINELSIDQFSATATIKSSRPIFNSDYNTVVFDLFDKDFEFKYDPFITLEYRETEFANNLTSMLAFYAYTIIGLDYDTFQRNAGVIYHRKAQEIISGASSAPFPGWTANNSNNRGQLSKYWINENLMNPKYRNLRDAYYDYHRNGLDRMYENPQLAWRSIIAGLKRIEQLNEVERNLPMVSTFFNSKKDELVGIFSEAPPNMKTQVVNIAIKVDPINSKTYNTILK